MNSGWPVSLPDAALLKGFMCLDENIWRDLSESKQQPLGWDQRPEAHVPMVQHLEREWVFKWVCGH